jgi:hypothetical protein
MELVAPELPGAQEVTLTGGHLPRYSVSQLQCMPGLGRVFVELESAHHENYDLTSIAGVASLSQTG